MKSLKFIFISLLGLYLFSGSVTSGWARETADQSLYGELLSRYVKNGVVDYQGFKKELEARKDKIKIKYLPYDWSLNGA